MSESAGKSKRSGLAVRVLLVTLVALGLANLVRYWALSKSDKEFEARLRAADELRN